MKNLQQIEDFYYANGLRGERLRKALERDADYSKLLKEKRKKISKRLPLTKAERKQFVLSTNEDFEILAMVRKLEKIKDVGKEDRALVKLIRSQLKLEWRKPLLKILGEILTKYKKRSFKY